MANRRLMAKQESGMPIAAVLFLDDGTIVHSAVNARTIAKKRDYKTHCEMHCIVNNSRQKSFNLIASIPPCKDCFAEIEKYGKIKNIYWLFDKYGKNSVKQDDVINIEQYEPQDKEEIKMINEMKKIYFKSQHNNK